MAWVDEKEYSRVDTKKVLDAADDLEKAVKKMTNALYNMKQAADKVFDASGEVFWAGDAADRWKELFYDARWRVAADIEKYQKFPQYMKDRVEYYIKAAIEAESTAEELNKDVHALLNDLLQETGGSARVRDIRTAYKDGKLNKS